ncbi:cytochrome P450 [Mycena sanguinolenta]|nr:cytochrome P450 [Mycena sanguinolenta]
MSASRWFLLAFFALLYLGLRWRRNRSKLPLPPGPKKLPLAYHSWSKNLNSDIIHLDAAGTPIVVLSSMEAIQDLFEQRSSLYSGRLRLPMLVELMGWDFAVPFINYGKCSHRRLFHETFNRSAAKQFHPQQTAAAHQVLRRFLQNPHDIMGHFRHLAGALIMDIAYGIKVLPSDDPYIQVIEQAMHNLSNACIPGAFLVDTFPALKYVPSWFPGAGFKRKAKEWRKVVREVLEKPFHETKRNIVRLSCLNPFKSLIKGVAATMYAAGADSTVSALGTFETSPDFADELSLPYVSAIVKEVLRWRNVTPIAFPHYIAVDDEYRGYRIPAGSLVIGNTWVILHDKEMYADPHSFNPERFLLDGKLNPAVRDPETAVFGFGRRICPGRYMATASIWIAVASMLAAFDIKKAVDKDGKEVEPSFEYSTTGIVS